MCTSTHARTNQNIQGDTTNRVYCKAFSVSTEIQPDKILLRLVIYTCVNDKYNNDAPDI